MIEYNAKNEQWIYTGPYVEREDADEGEWDIVCRMGDEDEFTDCSNINLDLQNARGKMLAAAPDLYRALAYLLDVFERGEAGFPQEYEIRVNAIETAKVALAKVE